jgi:hypothetical protein
MITLPIDATSVAQISAIEDPVLRNLWITQAYADLAERLRNAVNGEDHTWCGFAVWASATAGQSIRRQELPGTIVRLLDAARRRRPSDGSSRWSWWLRLAVASPLLLTDDIFGALDEAVDEVSTRIADGNKLVFDELAPLFVAFLEAVESGRLGSGEKDVAAVLRATRIPVADEVLEAFQWYARAVRTTDPLARSRCILAGNVLAVAHEQERLQADIAASMDAGPVCIAGLFERPASRGWVRRWLRGIRPVRRVVVRVANDAWDELMTELMMTLRVPGAKLRLDHDINRGPDGRLFPVELSDLSDPRDPSQPAVVYGRWDRTGGSGKHDGSRDWEQLPSRMNFIVNLFRSRQQDARLAAQPFAEAQLAAMRAGKLPDPPLLPPSR